MLDHRGLIANVTSGTSAVVIDVSTWTDNTRINRRQLP